MQNRSFPPTPWVKVGLAILPGLFALATGSGVFKWALGEDVAQTIAQGGLVVVCIPLITAGLIRERRLAVWRFPALGIVIPVLAAWWWVPLANMVMAFVDLPNPFWHLAPPVLGFAPLAAIAGAAAYRVWRRHGIQVPRLGWVLLGLMIPVTVAQAITTSVALARPYEWTALLAGLWLWHALWGMGVILSAVAIGLPLAWRNGTLAGLMVLAFQYIMTDGLLGCVVAGGQPLAGVCICTSYQTTLIVLSCLSSLAALLFLLVSPIWVLRSRSGRGRLWGLLLPPLITVVSSEAILAIVCRGTPGEYWIGWWLTHVLSSAQFIIPVALAAVLYRSIERQSPAAHRISPKQVTDSVQRR